MPSTVVATRQPDGDGSGRSVALRPSRRIVSRLEHGVVDGPGRQLAAVADAELAEDRREVGLDGARADEQLGGEVAVRRAADDEPGDLQLVRGQQLVRGDVLADDAAGGPQLGRRPFGEDRRPDAAEQLDGPLEVRRGPRPGAGPGAAARPR